MKLEGFPFTIVDWETIARSEHKGETGVAHWRTCQFGDVRVRIMEYSADYRTGYWCSKGHVFYCLQGELEIELEDGRKFTLTPGKSFQVADGVDRHRNYSRDGATFFVVD